MLAMQSRRDMGRSGLSKCPSSAARGLIAEALCLLVALFFAGRVGVGLLAPETYDTATQAYEAETESPTEKVEFDDDVEVFDLACLDFMTALSNTPSLSTIIELSRSVDSPLFRALQQVRGPPA